MHRYQDPTMMHRLLLIDNDMATRESVRKALNTGDFELNETNNLSEAREFLSAGKLDLIMLDWVEPDSHRIDFTRQLKNKTLTKHTPLILLTAHSAEEDQVRGLKAGADDYITKPISTEKLASRIMAWLIRTGDGNNHEGEVLQVDALCLDKTGYLATIAGEVVVMGPTEFRLLHFFMSHLNQAFTREKLLSNIWETDVDLRTIDVHIRRLRKALAPHGYDGYLQTVRTIGYRFSNYGVPQTNGTAPHTNNTDSLDSKVSLNKA